MRCLKLQLLVLLAATLLLNACAGWQSYVVTRGVRHFTGAPTRFHPVVPLSGGLKQYRVIEVPPLDNLVLELLPQKMEDYIDDRLLKDLQSIQKSIKSGPVVVRSVRSMPLDDQATLTPLRTLVVEGYIDDYDSGYAGLRLVELGFNHVAVTIRFQLRDKETGEIVAAASVTLQDDRATGSTKAAINKISKKIRGFVSSGYGDEK